MSIVADACNYRKCQDTTMNREDIWPDVGNTDPLVTVGHASVFLFFLFVVVIVAHPLRFPTVRPTVVPVSTVAAARHFELEFRSGGSRRVLKTRCALIGRRVCALVEIELAQFRLIHLLEQGF